VLKKKYDIETTQWLNFLNEPADEEVMDDAMFFPSPQQDVDVQDRIETSQEPDLTSNQRKGLRMSEFSLRFDGDLDMDQIAQSLRRILGSDARGELKITYKLS
jgi:hypothetical protein